MPKTPPRTRPRASLLFVAACAACAASAACYSYTPIAVAELQPGMGVRARVSPSASARIAPLLSTTDARVLIGTLISNERDTMVVEVPLSPGDAINIVERLNQRVSLARSDVVELESRRPDRLRTAAFAGGAALLVGAAVIKGFNNDPGKEKVPTGPGPDDALSPLFRRVP